MLIIVDENIPFAPEIFGSLGEVRLVAGRSLTPDDVREADALVVRSVTRVGEKLLAGSRVRFVGTSTIGTDHCDLDWLAGRGIDFSSAPGSNAESVAQYIAAALAGAAGRLGRALSRCSIGIVGVGNCGRRVERIARALGMEVRLNDPPLAQATGDAKYRPLEELLGCDFLSLHVPLTRAGEHATWRLIDEPVLDRLAPAVLINACRGFVVDEPALMARVRDGRLGGAILDAWENEPAIHPDHLRDVMLGTPHIAGYSFDGKIAGAVMIAEALARHAQLIFTAPPLPLPATAVPLIELQTAGRADDSILAELVQTAYPIGRDDADLRLALAQAGESIGPAFDTRRKLYPLRREFAATRVKLHDASPDLLKRVEMLGFELAQQ